MSIVAIISFYNDIDGMKRLYSHLHKCKIKSIWGDGRFKGFTRITNSDISTDGSREFIESKKDAILFTIPLCYEYESKSIMLQKAGGYDYAVVFDCDEYVTGDFDTLVSNLDKIVGDKPEIFRVDVSIIDNKSSVWKDNASERIFYKPHRIRCNNTHWSFFIDKSETPHISPACSVKGITVYHDQSIRDSSRDSMMDSYQHTQIIEEAEKLYVHSKKLAGRPTINALNTLFPTACIVESSSNFIIKENIDANKLPLNWTRCMTPDGLCIMK